MNMGARNSSSSGDFGGKSRKMRLKKLRKRDDMSFVEEDYHTGLTASVPFKWESEPGTPKPNDNDNDNDGAPHSPTITPPPSYFSNDVVIINSSPHLTNISSKPSFKPNFLNTVFKKLSVKPTLHPPSPASLSSSSSSTSSRETRRSASPTRSSFDSRVDDDDHHHENVQSPVSTLFFGRRSDKGCYPKLVKVLTRYNSK